MTLLLSIAVPLAVVSPGRLLKPRESSSNLKGRMPGNDTEIGALRMCSVAVVNVLISWQRFLPEMFVNANRSLGHRRPNWLDLRVIEGF